MHHSIGDLAEVLDNLGVFRAAPQDLVETVRRGFAGFRSRGVGLLPLPPVLLPSPDRLRAHQLVGVGEGTRWQRLILVRDAVVPMSSLMRETCRRSFAPIHLDSVRSVRHLGRVGVKTVGKAIERLVPVTRINPRYIDATSAGRIRKGKRLL
jgi:hypothetical protein